MPLYEGNISHVTLSGIIDPFNGLLKIEYKFCFILGEFVISRARNTITKLLDDEEFKEHIYFLDADIGFSHENFEY